jgi:DNA-binding response OmpR family regulator
MAKILIVEDEPQMLEGLKDTLEIEGFDVETAADGSDGLNKILQNTYDLAILDVMLPHKSGFDILKTAREKGISTPVIMLTAKGEEIDRVLGLELGADDYITKPFSLRELLARVKAVIRRAEAGAGGVSGSMMRLGECEIDFSAYTASRGSVPLDMTPREYEILKYLWQHKNQTVSRDQLLTNVWGYEEPVSTRTVDNFILRLRQKIEVDPTHPKHIMTIHGTGYKLVV